MLFFMHLKYEANWKYVLTIPASIMAIFLILALVPDVKWRFEEIIGGRDRQLEERLRFMANPPASRPWARSRRRGSIRRPSREADRRRVRAKGSAVLGAALQVCQTGTGLHRPQSVAQRRRGCSLTLNSRFRHVVARPGGHARRTFATASAGRCGTCRWTVRAAGEIIRPAGTQRRREDDAVSVDLDADPHATRRRFACWAATSGDRPPPPGRPWGVVFQAPSVDKEADRG